MHWRNVAGALCVITLLAPAAAQAQTVVSPEVKHTGTGPTGYEVTIRVYDPTATRVRVKGEWYFSSASESSGVPATSPGRVPTQWRPGDFPMPFPNALAPNWPVDDLTLDPATGVWSFTTPLPPGTFTYALYRNCNATPPNLTGCTATSDPSNPPWNTGKGTVEPTSQVYVPSDPAFGSEDLSWQAPIAAAGTLQDVEYPSSISTNPVGKHYLGVYLPPGLRQDPGQAVPADDHPPRRRRARGALAHPGRREPHPRQRPGRRQDAARGRDLPEHQLDLGRPDRASRTT